MNDFHQDFVAHLVRLRKENPGALAELRRSLSFAPGAYPRAYPFVERFVAPERHEQDARRLALYVVAGLFALHPKSTSQSLASSLGALMRERGSDSIERRFIALLGADAENLPAYLRQVTSLLASNETGLNYAGLLKDLSLWMNVRLDPEVRDRIRQRWARDFYRASASGNDSQITTQNQEG